MDANAIRELKCHELDQVAGASKPGPNGEGCTEPPISTKPGQDLTSLQILFG